MNRHDQRLLSDLSDSFRRDLSLVESSILSPLGISAIRPKTNIHVVHVSLGCYSYEIVCRPMTNAFHILAFFIAVDLRKLR